MADLVLLSSVTVLKNTNIQILDIDEIPTQQDTLTPGVDLPAGSAVKPNGTTGKWMLCNGTTAPLADLYGITVRTGKLGQTGGVTAIRRGILSGWDLSAVAYWADIFLGDSGALSTTAGTVSRKVGKVVPLRGQVPGATPMKGIMIEINN